VQSQTPSEPKVDGKRAFEGNENDFQNVLQIEMSPFSKQKSQLSDLLLERNCYNVEIKDRHDSRTGRFKIFFLGNIGVGEILTIKRRTRVDFGFRMLPMIDIDH
jgi:hypothetical protein